MAIRKRGKSWVVDVYIGGREGKRIRKSFTEKEQAQAYEHKMKLAEFTGDVIEPKQESISLSALIDKYKLIHDSLNTEETQARNARIMKIIADTVGDVPIRIITQEIIETYKATRLRKVKAVTVNIELRIVRSLLNRAAEWGYIKSSPSVKLIRIDEEPPKFLLPDEGAKVIAAALGQMKTFIIVGLYTGLRRGEMFRLRWNDIDIVNRRLTVRKSKGRKFRVVPINENLADGLAKHPRHIKSNLIFYVRDGEAWKDPRTAYNNSFDRAGVTRMRIHDMRHSFISNLVALGVDLRTVQELAGHANIQTTMKYAHLAPGRLKESVEKLQWGQEKK